MRVAARPKAELLPWLAFAAMVLIWGSSFLAIRVSHAEGFAPLAAAAWRMVAAALVLLGVARLAGLPFPGRRGVLVSMAVGFCYFGLNLPLLYWGELTVPSATAAVLWGIYPALVTMAAHGALRGAEPLTARSLAGAGAAGLGLVVVFWSHLRFDAPVAGFAAILAGVLASTVGTLVQKRWATGIHAVVLNGFGVLAGALVLVPVAFVVEGGLEAPPTLGAWGASLFLLVAGSLVAFPLWSWVLQRWPATRLSYQTVLSPLVAVLLGALVGEPIGSLFLAGAAIVLAGTWLAVRAPPAARAGAVSEERLMG